MVIFSKKSIGLDIADHTIEAAELVQDQNGIRVANLNKAYLEPCVIINGRIKDAGKLKAAVEQALSGMDPAALKKKMAFGLPESQVYIHNFELDSGNVQINEEAVIAELQNSIPIEKGKMLFDHKLVDVKAEKTPEGKAEKNKKFRILSVAINKDIVEEWQSFFEQLGIKLNSFDIESLAIRRGLVFDYSEPVCIVDIGATTTNLIIYNKSGLYYSYSFDCAGDNFSKALSEALSISLEEAEKKKSEIGLLAGPEDKVFQVLMNELQKILREINSAFEYYKERTGEVIGRIVLVGGSSRMKGLVEQFGGLLTELNKKYQQASFQPAGEQGTGERKNIIAVLGTPIISDPPQTNEYIEAIGLALRGLEPQKYRKDPCIKMALKKTDYRALLIKKYPKLEPLLRIRKAQEKKAEIRKIRLSKETLLAVVLLLGIVLVPGSFWYRSQTSKKRVAQFTQKRLQSSPNLLKKTINIKAAIETDPTLYSEQTIRGRVATTTIEKAVSADKLASKGMELLNNEKKPGEVSWDFPIDMPVAGSMLVFPMQLHWILFSDSDARNIFINEIKKSGGEEKFAIDTITYTKLDRVSTSTRFDIFGTVGITAIKMEQAISPAPPLASTSSIEKNSGEPVDKAQELLKALEAARKAKKDKTITVQSTDTGWLNVRTGPSKTSQLIKKVYAGEKYRYSEEKDGWIKIRLDEKQTGWVSAEYVDKNN